MCQVARKRCFQTHPTRRIKRGRESRFHFADAPHAQKQCADILGRQPVLYFGFRARTHQLGRDVGVQKKAPVHDRSTGRAGDGLRVNIRSISWSVSKPRISAKASISA